MLLGCATSSGPSSIRVGLGSAVSHPQSQPLGPSFACPYCGAVLSPKAKVACPSLLLGSLASCPLPQARVTPREGQVTTVPFIVRDTTGLSELQGPWRGAEEEQTQTDRG